MIKKNDVIQVVDKNHPFYGCLMQVTGLSEKNVYAFLRQKKDRRDKFVFNHDQVAAVGESNVE